MAMRSMVRGAADPPLGGDSEAKFLHYARRSVPDVVIGRRRLERKRISTTFTVNRCNQVRIEPNPVERGELEKTLQKCFLCAVLRFRWFASDAEADGIHLAAVRLIKR